MKKLYKHIVTFILLLSVHGLLSQTVLPKRIAISQTLTINNSPYQINDTCFVEEGVVLTIDPGVQIDFTVKNKKLIVNGTLIVNGSKSSRVKFNNALIEFTSKSVDYDTLSGNGSKLINCDFIGQGANSKGISLYSTALLIDGFSAADNYYMFNCFANSSLFISNSVFKGIVSNGNGSGYFTTNGVNVLKMENCKVHDYQSIELGLFSDITKSEFIVKHYYAGFKVRYGTQKLLLSCNYFKGFTYGVDLSGLSAPLTNSVIEFNTFDSLTNCFNLGCNTKLNNFKIEYNNFKRIQGKYFDFVSNCSGSSFVAIDVKNNYWGTIDTIQIKDRIEDNSDLSSYPFLFVYGPILKEEVTNCSIPNNTEINNLKIEYKLFPNPTSGVLKFQNLSEREFQLEIFDANGVSLYKLISAENTTIDLSKFIDKGIYFLRIIDGKKTYMNKLIYY